MFLLFSLFVIFICACVWVCESETNQLLMMVQSFDVKLMDLLYDLQNKMLLVLYLYLLLSVEFEFVDDYVIDLIQFVVLLTQSQHVLIHRPLRIRKWKKKKKKQGKYCTMKHLKRYYNGWLSFAMSWNIIKQFNILTM